MRYNELKFDGKIYTEQWKIDEILIEHNFKWLVNAEIENARLEIIKDTLVWNAGIWYNGTWEFGVFRDGEWKYGTWEGGVWYNGKWKDGTFKAGIIYKGIFIKGKILGGEIRGGKFIDCDISSRVKEYVEGEKEHEQEELTAPTIEPVRVKDSQVQAPENGQVQETKKNIHKMSKIKDFKGFINEEYHEEYREVGDTPEDLFSYLDLSKPEYLSEDTWILNNISLDSIPEVIEEYFNGEDITQYFEDGNIVLIRVIGDDGWELKFECDNYDYDFIPSFVQAIERYLGPGNVLIDDPTIAEYLTESKIVESTGDIEPQFVGNRYDNVNVKQVAGGIELSSYSKTDIYNMKQIHGGEVVEKDNGLYVLYITNTK